jgi:hypothetical protein
MGMMLDGYRSEPGGATCKITPLIVIRVDPTSDVAPISARHTGLGPAVKQLKKI